MNYISKINIKSKIFIRLLTNRLVVFLIAAAFTTFFASGVLAQSWTEPAASPPAQNSQGPLDSGSDTQSKLGAFSIGSPGGANYATEAGELYVEGDIETGVSVYLSGNSSQLKASNASHIMSFDAVSHVLKLYPSSASSLVQIGLNNTGNSYASGPSSLFVRDDIEVEGTINIDNELKVLTPSSSGDPFHTVTVKATGNEGVYATTDATSGSGESYIAAVEGVITGGDSVLSTTPTYGIYGQSNQSSGAGIYGESDTTGLGAGDLDSAGKAVIGTHADSGYGIGSGVYGETDSSAGAAIYAINSATSDPAYAGYFKGNLVVADNTLGEGGKLEAEEFCIGGSCLTSWPASGSASILMPSLLEVLNAGSDATLFTSDTLLGGDLKLLSGKKFTTPSIDLNGTSRTTWPTAASGSDTFKALTDTPASYGTAYYNAAVNSATDGIEYVSNSLLTPGLYTVLQNNSDAGTYNGTTSIGGRLYVSSADFDYTFNSIPGTGENPYLMIGFDDFSPPSGTSSTSQLPDTMASNYQGEWVIKGRVPTEFSGSVLYDTSRVAFRWQDPDTLSNQGYLDLLTGGITASRRLQVREPETKNDIKIKVPSRYYETKGVSVLGNAYASLNSIWYGQDGVNADQANIDPYRLSVNPFNGFEIVPTPSDINSYAVGGFGRLRSQGIPSPGEIGGYFVGGPGDVVSGKNMPGGIGLIGVGGEGGASVSIGRDIETGVVGGSVHTESQGGIGIYAQGGEGANSYGTGMAAYLDGPVVVNGTVVVSDDLTLEKGFGSDVVFSSSTFSGNITMNDGLLVTPSLDSNDVFYPATATYYGALIVSGDDSEICLGFNCVSTWPTASTSGDALTLLESLILDSDARLFTGTTTFTGPVQLTEGTSASGRAEFRYDSSYSAFEIGSSRDIVMEINNSSLDVYNHKIGIGTVLTVSSSGIHAGQNKHGTNKETKEISGIVKKGSLNWGSDYEIECPDGQFITGFDANNTSTSTKLFARCSYP